VTPHIKVTNNIATN